RDAAGYGVADVFHVDDESFPGQLEPLADAVQHHGAGLVRDHRIDIVERQTGLFAGFVDGARHLAQGEFDHRAAVHEDVAIGAHVAVAVRIFLGRVVVGTPAHAAGRHDQIVGAGTVGAVDERADSGIALGGPVGQQGSGGGVAE